MVPGNAQPSFEATLSGYQVVPPVSTSAYGSVNVYQSGSTYYFVLTINDLPAGSTITGLSLRGPAVPGDNGAALTGFRWAADASGLYGDWEPSVNDLMDLSSGLVYLEVLIQGHPNSALRGQFMTVTPTTTTVATTTMSVSRVPPPVARRAFTFSLTYRGREDHEVFSTVSTPSAVIFSMTSLWIDLLDCENQCSLYAQCMGFVFYPAQQRCVGLANLGTSPMNTISYANSYTRELDYVYEQQALSSTGLYPTFPGWYFPAQERFNLHDVTQHECRTACTLDDTCLGYIVFLTADGDTTDCFGLNHLGTGIDYVAEPTVSFKKIYA
jgi:hypothetical protein